MSSRSQRRTSLIDRFQSLSYLEKQHFRDKLMETTHVMHSIPIQEIPNILTGKQKPRLFQTDLSYLEAFSSESKSEKSTQSSSLISLKSLIQTNPVGVAPLITQYLDLSNMTTTMGRLNTRTYRTLYQQSLPLVESFTISHSNQFPVLRSMKSLKHLRCTYGVKTTRLADYTRSITTLETLDLHDNQLRAIGMKTLAPSLRCFQKLRTINLSANQLREEGIQWLIPLLQHSFPHLQNLDVSSNDMGERGMANLAPCFMSLTRLKTLNVSSNMLGKEGITQLAPSLIYLSQLKEFNVSSNELGEEGLSLLAPFLIQLFHLKRLDLSSNELGKLGMKVLVSRVLPHFRELEMLDLFGNDIGDVGMETLASGIPQTLTSLSLYDNQIGAIGAKALAKALQPFTKLETLNLGRNRIGEEGMKALAPSLKSLTQLKILNLFRNRIGTQGFKALVSSMKSLDHVRQFYTEPLRDMTMEESNELSLLIPSLRFLESIGVEDSTIYESKHRSLLLALIAHRNRIRLLGIKSR